jgi:murein DD-endopeptidase MepM/ murein hydrolase activator NlpD
MAVERRRDERARIFTIGAAYGFVAGVFAMALLVWQFGDLVATRAVARPDPRVVVDTHDSKDDVDSPIIETPRPAPTSGTDPEVKAPAMSAPLAAELKNRDLEVPVEGVRRDQLTRQFDDARGGRRHEALDILAPHGTPVKAVEGGRVARLFQSKAGGITIYQFDPTETYCYYYAHLDRYAPGLREGERLQKGQVIGYVGTTGNAPKNTPHLHFAVFRLSEQKRWWEGTPLDPYDILR